MLGKPSISRRIFIVVNTLFMIFMALICLLPFTHVLFASISSPEFVTQNKGLILYPRGVNLKGYELIFQNPNIITGYLNTIFYTVVGTIVNILFTVMAAYVLSRKGPILNKYFIKIMTFTMFFSGGLIPFFLVVDALGFTGSRWSLIIPSLVSTYNIIIMRTSFSQLPISLEESARMDGANDFVILFRIIIPLSMPVIAVIILFYAVGHWNSWFNAILFLRDRDTFPLQLILREILITNDVSKMMAVRELSAMDSAFYRMLIKYSAIVVATLPIIFIYPFFQKYFVEGVMIGSIKE